MPRKRNGDYAVGYGKPPTHTRFKPGKTGNPNGRPKGSVVLKDIAGRVFKEKVVLVEGGKRKPVLKVEVMLKQFLNQAVKGDLKAGYYLIRLMNMLEAAETGASMQESHFSRADQETLARMLGRKLGPAKTDTDKEGGDGDA